MSEKTIGQQLDEKLADLVTRNDRKRSLPRFAQAVAGMGLCMNPARARASVSAM